MTAMPEQVHLGGNAGLDQGTVKVDARRYGYSFVIRRTVDERRWCGGAYVKRGRVQVLPCLAFLFW
jgi:hypothetical protein